MLNENYRKFIGGILDGGTNIVLTPYKYYEYNRNPLTFQVSTYNTITTPYPYPGDQSIYFKNGISLILGNGDERPTSKDIKLSNEVSNVLSYVTGSTIQGTADYNKFVAVTYKNNTEDVITIKEVGLMMQETNNAGYYRKALLGRVVLDTPVVMSPGDTYTFTYCIE